MKRGIVLALLAPGVAAIFVWAGCAAVLDLGDEARLRTEDAMPTTDSATPIVDAGSTPDSTTEQVICGLPAVVNPACSVCTKDKLCDLNQACAAEPGCPEALECLQDCMAQIECINKCMENSPALNNLALKSAEVCPQCTPQTKCIALGKCASLLDPDGGAILRKVARTVILELDESKCDDTRTNLIGSVLDASECH